MPSHLSLSRHEATQRRILDKADHLFHRMGFYKTTVVDIARELEMSSANIYKFFPSKNALVQAVAERNLTQIREAILESIEKEQSSINKIRRLVQCVHRFHHHKLKTDQEIYRLVLAAHNEQWPCVIQFKDFLHTTLENIVQEGLEAQQFSHLESSMTAGILMDCLAWILNPLLMYALKDIQVGKRINAQMRFIDRALT